MQKTDLRWEAVYHFTRPVPVGKSPPPGKTLWTRKGVPWSLSETACGETCTAPRISLYSSPETGQYHGAEIPLEALYKTMASMFENGSKPFAPWRPTVEANDSDCCSFVWAGFPL